MEYRSTMHCTSNEAGQEEVQITYENGFFRDLFKLPEKKETYVGGGTVWRDKETGNRAPTTKEAEICDIVFRHANSMGFNETYHFNRFNQP